MRTRLLLGGVVALLLAAYVFSRLAAIMTLPIFFDEAHYTLSALLIGRDPLHTDPFVEVAYWGVPPLFTWLAAPLARLSAEPLLAARLTSALIGLAALLGTWRCARALGGLPLALASAALFVLCPFLLLYQRMAMVDGLLTAVGAFALLYALRLTREPSPRAAVLLGLYLALGCLSKITGPLLLSLPLIAIVAAAPEQRRAVIRPALVAILLGLAAGLALVLLPEGASLIAVAGQQQRLSEPFINRTLTQAVIIAQSLWFYVTPPVLLLAVLGLRGVRRTSETRVLALWAVLSLLPFALMHLGLNPRYLLPGAVPLLLLAARGLLTLVGGIAAQTYLPRLACMMHEHRRKGEWFSRGRRPRTPLFAPHALSRLAFGIALAVLAVVASVAADVPLVADPAHAAMPPQDHRQYVSGWPAGYALTAALADARRLAHGRPLTLISSLQNPPGDALAVLLGNDPRVHLLFRDFTTLQGRGALTRYAPATFVVVCPPQGQRIDARRAGLHLVAHVPNGDGIGSVDLYAPNRTLGDASNANTGGKGGAS